MKKITNGFISLIFLAAMLVALSACNANNAANDNTSNNNTTHNNAPTHDREGFPITLPEQINTIITIGPSNAEVLVELGFSDAIIQTDVHAANIPGIQPGISTLDIFAPNLELIIDLAPDIVFITGMARLGGDYDPLSQVTAAGISVIYMPTSTSIADIKEDIRFMAAVLGAEHSGEEVIAYMDEELNRIREIGESITERRTVYFEISPAPHLVSFGEGTFLNEMIELAGAINIFADQEGWISVADEVLLEMNPDVILTSVNFIDDPIGDIMDRPGWGAITAIQNGDVFVISTDYSNRPSHNIIRALRQIAEAVYPDEFQ